MTRAKDKLNGYQPERPMHLTAVCQHNGCDLPALRVPVLKVPVKGLPALEPYEVMIEHELCPGHVADLPVRDYLTKLVRGGCKYYMRLAGVEPDFERAYFDSIHIMSAEYRAHQKVKHGDADANAVRLVDRQRRTR